MIEGWIWVAMRWVVNFWIFGKTKKFNRFLSFLFILVKFQLLDENFNLNKFLHSPVAAFSSAVFALLQTLNNTVILTQHNSSRLSSMFFSPFQFSFLGGLRGPKQFYRRKNTKSEWMELNWTKVWDWGESLVCRCVCVTSCFENTPFLPLTMGIIRMKDDEKNRGGWNEIKWNEKKKEYKWKEQKQIMTANNFFNFIQVYFILIRFRQHNF